MGEFPTPIPQEELPKIVAREYRQDEVISPEMEAGLAQISPEAVDHLTKVIGLDWENFQKQTVANQSLEWPDRFIRMDQIAEDELKEASDVEKETTRAFWGIGTVLGQVRHRNQLKNVYEKTTDSHRKEEIRKEYDGLNITASSWQNSVCKMILSLSATREGREFVSRFWRSFDELAGKYLEAAKEDAQKMRNGILGQITAIHVLEALGVRPYFSSPDQDALQKIDLWGARGGKIFAFQVKSHARGGLRLFAEQLTTPEDTSGLSSREKREIEQRNLLLTRAQNYGKKWGTDVIPFWMDLDHPKGDNIFQDETTGQPRIPPGIQKSGFALTINRLTGGVPGESAKGP